MRLQIIDIPELNIPGAIETVKICGRRVLRLSDNHIWTLNVTGIDGWPSKYTPAKLICNHHVFIPYLARTDYIGSIVLSPRSFTCWIYNRKICLFIYKNRKHLCLYL